MTSTPSSAGDIIHGEFNHVHTSGAAQEAVVAEILSTLEAADPAAVDALCKAAGVATGDKRTLAAWIAVAREALKTAAQLGLSGALFGV